MISGTREPLCAIMHKGRVSQLAGILSTDLLSYLIKALVTCLVCMYMMCPWCVTAAGRATEAVCVRQIFIPS